MSRDRVVMTNPEGERREVEAPSDELVQLMVAGWYRDKAAEQGGSIEPVGVDDVAR